MSLQSKALWVSLAVAVALPAPAWAFGGGAGCADLPEYARAQGALEGMTGACDMTIERAREITAAHDGSAAAPATGRYSPSQLRRMRRHRVRATQPN